MSKLIPAVSFLCLVLSFCIASDKDFNDDKRIEAAIAQHNAEQSQCRMTTKTAANFAFQEGYLARQSEEMTSFKVSLK